MSAALLAPERPAVVPLGIDRLLAALSLHRAGRLLEAEAGYRAFLAEDASHPTALRLLGMLLNGMGRYTEAIAMLRAAIAAKPDDPDGQTALGDACAAAGQAEEAIAAYRAVLAQFPAHNAARVNLANVLLAVGDRAGAVAECRLALVSAPRLLAAHVTMGAALLGGGKVVEAIGAYRTAVGIDDASGAALTGYANALLHDRRAVDALDAATRACACVDTAEAWFLRGAAERALRQFPTALQSLERAVGLAPNHAQALLALGNTWADLDDLDRADNMIRRAIAAAPEMAEAQASLGYVLQAQGDLSGAIAACARGIALRPDFARAHWNRATALLLAGDLPAGFAAYEWRRRDALFAADFRPPDSPEWQGEPLAGRRLLVIAEQGFGDAIQFARFIPMLVALGAEVVVSCPPQLAKLFARLEGNASIAPFGGPLPAHDMHVFQMSLPLRLGTTLDTIPAPRGYLSADSAREPAANSGRRVGLAWAGNPAHRNDQRRSLPTEALAPLAQLPCIDWVNLQLDARGTELALMHRLPPPPRRIADFADTAALVGSLDLVITADTAVAHLAGALGKPVWIMLPHAPDWRWMLGREDSPWYTAARLFRQERPGDWGGVIARIVAALGEGDTRR
ncbi:MAG: tetratricopeptide repeat protein [Alphaproteobacteria bacterium]|nr:tetratricopeptide repeat protein [Alphaproteobacteria bacterium]